MRRTKILIISSILGAFLAFSIWPVLSGAKISPGCRDNPLADCIPVEQTSPRILYYLSGQNFDYAGFDSRDQYCDIVGSCKLERIYVPLSILVGAISGAIIGITYIKLKKFI